MLFSICYLILVFKIKSIDEVRKAWAKKAGRRVEYATEKISGNVLTTKLYTLYTPVLYTPVYTAGRCIQPGVYARPLYTPGCIRPWQ